MQECPNSSSFHRISFSVDPIGNDRVTDKQERSNLVFEEEQQSSKIWWNRNTTKAICTNYLLSRWFQKVIFLQRMRQIFRCESKNQFQTLFTQSKHAKRKQLSLIFSCLVLAGVLAWIRNGECGEQSFVKDPQFILCQPLAFQQKFLVCLAVIFLYLTLLSFHCPLA